jgi:hypothetical protein
MSSADQSTARRADAAERKLWTTPMVTLGSTERNTGSAFNTVAVDQIISASSSLGS